MTSFAFPVMFQMPFFFQGNIIILPTINLIQLLSLYKALKAYLIIIHHEAQTYMQATLFP